LRGVTDAHPRACIDPEGQDLLHHWDYHSGLSLAAIGCVIQVWDHCFLRGQCLLRRYPRRRSGIFLGFGGALDLPEAIFEPGNDQHAFVIYKLERPRDMPEGKRHLKGDFGDGRKGVNERREHCTISYMTQIPFGHGAFSSPGRAAYTRYSLVI
jgi:hypothetical protein